MAGKVRTEAGLEDGVGKCEATHRLFRTNMEAAAPGGRERQCLSSGCHNKIPQKECVWGA